MDALRHPDQERVKELIQDIVDTTRRASEWTVQMMEFDFYTGSYQAILTWNGNSTAVRIQTEVIDDAYSGDNFKRRRIKRAIKEAVRPFFDLPD
jgi:hypothetical protein